MKIGDRENQSPGGGYARRRLAPVVEVFESRQLLTGGVGSIAGTVFLDADKSGLIDPADAYLPGVTVELFKAGGATPIATTVADAAGGYAFKGLEPGNYFVTERPLANQAVVANRSRTDLYPSSSVKSDTIAVTVTDPARAYVNYKGVLPDGYIAMTNVVNGRTTDDAVGSLGASLGTAPGKSDLSAGFVAFCLDDLHRLEFAGGASFQVTPRPLTDLTNGASSTPISADHAGRIGYLFNHYGNASLTNVQAAGLQLAVWELIYDTGVDADYAAGNFQVKGAIDPAQSGLVNQAITQAKSFFAESQGKSEAGLYLQATSALAPGPVDGFQSLVARGSFDFLNVPTAVGGADSTVSSLSGFTYCDANDNGVKDPSEPAISGVTVTLTGTDGSGKPVTLSTQTDATGFYQFTNLKAGTYSITETQPAGYLDGKDTQGTPKTGVIENDRFRNIILPGGVNGQDNNFGERLPAPAVSTLQLIGIHQNPTTIVLKFDGALDPAKANDPAGYKLVALGRDEKLGTRDDRQIAVTSATYDAVTNTVTLSPDRHLNIHYHYVIRLTVPAASSCAPPAHHLAVFGRSSVPYFTTHKGVHYPAPALTAREVKHNAAVVRQAQGVLARNGGVFPAQPMKVHHGQTPIGNRGGHVPPVKQPKAPKHSRCP